MVQLLHKAKHLLNFSESTLIEYNTFLQHTCGTAVVALLYCSIPLMCTFHVYEGNVYEGTHT